MKIASYKSTQTGWRGIANRMIRFRLRGDHSHTEVVFLPGDRVEHLMPDGTCEPIDGAYWCASSVAAELMPAWSPRRAGRFGGVRFKRIQLDTEKWDVVDYPRYPARAAQWFVDHQGASYDWHLIFSFLAWFVPNREGRFTCSEAAAAAGGHPDPFRFDPCVLHAAYNHADFPSADFFMKD